MSAATIALEGEYDLSNATELRARLEAEVLDRAGEVVEVDMSGVTFFDSTALSVVLGAHKRAAGGGGAVVLVRETAEMRRLLELTGLAQILLSA